MNPCLRLPFLRVLLAGAFPVLFLFLSIVPASAGEVLTNSNISVAKAIGPKLRIGVLCQVR